MTDYDWPESYVYRPWPIDNFSRKVLSPKRIIEIKKNIESVRKLFPPEQQKNTSPNAD